ncbi:hypothetical protein QCA50_006961 [Cerrena zonata]|uniref:Uncharacterized protein n=1 Tax=Cerrena zonata TaxID=2478898 RepID=A0AAW0GGE4_9APHY
MVLTVYDSTSDTATNCRSPYSQVSYHSSPYNIDARMSSTAQPPHGLRDIVDLVRSKHTASNAEDEHPQDPPLGILPRPPRHEESAAEQAEHSTTVADIHTAMKERGATKDEPKTATYEDAFRRTRS